MKPKYFETKTSNFKHCDNNTVHLLDAGIVMQMFPDMTTLEEKKIGDPRMRFDDLAEV